MAVQTSRNRATSEPKEPEQTIEFDGETEEVEGFQVVDAAEVAKETPFPEKILKADDSDKFFDWVNNPGVNWTTKTVYAYRQWPVIDRRKQDKQKPIYIDVIGNAFTLEDFLQQHGGGKYKFLINDSTKAIAGKGGTIGTAYLSCMGSNYPEPKILLDEIVLEARENRAYVDRLIAEGKLTSDGRPMANNPVVGGGPTTVDPNIMALLTELIRNQQRQQALPKDTSQDNIASMYVKTHETTMQMLKDQLKGDDPDKLIKLAGLIIPLLQQKPQDNSGLLELLLKTQAESAKAVAEAAKSREDMMLKFFETMNAKKEESSLDAQLETLMKLKELTESGGSRGKGSFWETAIEAGAPLLGKVFDIIQNVMTVKNYAAGLAGTAPVGNPSPVVPSVTAGGEKPKENVVEMPQQPVNQFAMLLKQYGGLIINALNNGQSGADFAASLEGMFGELAYDQIAAIGKEGLVKQMKEVPEFWGNVAAVEGKVEKFVEEFVEYGKEEEEAK